MEVISIDMLKGAYAIFCEIITSIVHFSKIKNLSGVISSFFVSGDFFKWQEERNLYIDRVAIQV